MADNEFTAFDHPEVRISTVDCADFASVVRDMEPKKSPLENPFDREPNGPDQKYWLELERSMRIAAYLGEKGYGVADGDDGKKITYFGSHGCIDGMLGMPFRLVMTQFKPYEHKDVIFGRNTIASVQECLFRNSDGGTPQTIDEVTSVDVADYYVPCRVTAMLGFSIQSIGLIGAELDRVCGEVDVVALNGGEVHLYHGDKENNRASVILEMKQHLRDRGTVVPILAEMSRAVPAYVHNPMTRNPHI